MDAFGVEIPVKTSMRLVDLKVNGHTFKSHPVIQRELADGEEPEEYGYLGMDLLKNRVLYYDGGRNEFILLTRQSR